tara:strand:+ start:1645 stop:1911 length:267 start_codon:yes stop_codon:yes gene_type:complete
MIPRNIVQTADVQAAACYLIENKIPNNSTKFDVEIVYENTVQYVAPKRLISEAFVFASGESLPVHTFSGGQESNSFLKKLGFEVKRKN